MSADTTSAYAVVETGGKQYMVRQGQVFQVELIDAEEGKNVVLKKVLAVSDGKKLTTGKPSVPKAEVACTVIAHTRGPKSVSFKKKRRKGYTRKMGHRQSLTTLRVESIK